MDQVRYLDDSGNSKGGAGFSARTNSITGKGLGEASSDQQPEQKEYTLPGIMQYLQSQFTLSERNRMQNDLERSSLKLKIIELESERNSLKLKNEKLKMKVERLEQALSKYEASDSKSATGLLRNLSLGKRHSNDSKQNNSGTDFDKDLAEINTIDVEKLLKARKFLKTATSEIMYLLKSPNVELEDPLHLSKQDMFMDTTQSYGPQSNSGKTDDDYMDINIPFDSASKKGVKTAAFNEGPKNVSSETSTVVSSDDNNDDSNDQASQSKVKILKRAPSQETRQNAVLKMSRPSEFGKVIGGKLYCYDKVENTLQQFSGILQGCKLDCTYICPESFGSIIDMKINAKYLVMAGKSEILIFSLSSQQSNVEPFVLYRDVGDDLKSIDLNSKDQLVVVYGSSVKTFQIQQDSHTLLPTFTTSYTDGGQLLCSRYISYRMSYDIAILTSKSLILQSTAPEKEESEGTQVINLSNFDHYLLTSKNLVINLMQGLFLIDFSNLSAFSHVPLTRKLGENAYLGTCEDDSSVFYVRVSQDSIELFKVIETGDIFNIKTLGGLARNSLWCSVGNADGKFTICIGNRGGVQVHPL